MNEIPDIEDTYHYWRECHTCGYAGNNYLHCLHDLHQSSCVKCGNKLPSIPRDCDCEFVKTETELEAITQSALSSIKQAKISEREAMMELLHLTFEAPTKTDKQ